MLGVFGKYADVDLVTGKVSGYEIPEDWYIKHIGGRGIAARILLKELPPRIDPLSPQNILVFATGPFQGLNISGASRFLVMAKSPKTWTINGSYCGGRFGHLLGKSGYDGLIVHGKANEPVYILIDTGGVSIHSAKELWGLTPKEVEKQLQAKHGNLSVACIGKAGENGVMMSCVIVDHNRAAGRPGYGAIMASKNLKAVVVRGTKTKPVAHNDQLRSLRAQFARELMSGDYEKNMHEHGTSFGLASNHELGILPTKNFATGMFIHYDQITGQRMVESGLLIKRDTCPGCPIVCKRVVKGSFHGEAFDPYWGGPEYETIAALGSLCLNGDLPSICLMNQKCNQYGLDTISVGVATAYLMEATEKGLLTGEEAIQWGDTRAMLRLIDKITYREGIGEWVARGVYYLGSKVGDSSFLMHTKGQELPMHEPRGKLSLAVYYAMTPRGGQHMEGIHDPNPANPELGLEANERLSWHDKAKITGTYLNLRSFSNSLILCAFNAELCGGSYRFPLIRAMLEATTGLAIDVAETLKIGQDGRITEIGQAPNNLGEIEGQYIGLMKFSEKGLFIIKELFKKAISIGRLGTKRPEKAYMTDLLQAAIDEGHEVWPVLIEGDWVEIDTVNDLNLEITLERLGKISQV